MTERTITDEQVETALRKWFKDEVTWDKGMAPWTADQFRVEMRATLEAALTLPSAGEPFQARVQPWMMACFGAEISGDKLERGDRLLEEVFELLQSGDYPRERIRALEEYTYSRPKGEPRQEVGGVMVTLAAYCLAHDLDMHEAGEAELARIWTKVDKIRAKQAAKPVGSALPVALPSPSASEAQVNDVLGWIKRCTARISNAIGGGSELFLRHGEEYRLDIDFVCKRISDMRERQHESMHRAIRAERALAAVGDADKLADKIEDLIAEFGDDPKVALQCVSEWLDLRCHSRHSALSTPEQGETPPSPETHVRVTDEMVDRAWRAYQDFGWSTEEGMRRAVEAAVAHATLPHTNDGPSYLDFITPDNVFDRGPDAVQAWQEAKSAEISRHPPTTKTLGCDDGVIATKDSLNVCRAWAELASENERLREILRPFADVIDGISDEFPNFQRVGSINGNFGKLRLGMFRNARAALISVKTPPSRTRATPPSPSPSTPSPRKDEI
ncbi:hypothetical protein QTA58_22890 [Neorhizobium sp. CSC1952]|uniref:hypothetical protein n=1 Tax=Neorhizobium sp. CSC1952 TaxID=2978974 RepID=UPI0025A57912|nr:hypothetical protein [Rhizobium sp. CSC1952]WJR67000.1 hypothetical protein QTA58_22890 [Rhizobium sp. CSC1952]